MALFSLNLTKNALTVLERRYLQKDETKKVIETPEQLFERVAKNVAKADLNYNKMADVNKIADSFYEIMANLEFLPNSPTLMNAGRDLQQLSACFVLPVGDSMEEIFEAIKNTAIIHKTGGGTGFSFSRLRPKNDNVKTTGGVASGPISFMKVFNAATEAVKQGGTRRGANMGILRVDHPDILEFITSKQDFKELTNFNISVAITEEFMKAVSSNHSYSLLNPRTKKVVFNLNAQDVFDTIVKMAHQTGEPGIVFIDRVNKSNPTPLLGEIESTNPCGEQPLLPYESCNLGSINLSRMVKDGKINFKRLEYVTKLSVHFLDNVIDMNKYPLKKIEEMTRGNRKIGLGVMGFADMLIQLGIPYNSEEALSIAEEVMKFIKEKAKEASKELAQKRGVFPNFSKSIYYKDKERLRNATLTTIAPTGTLSIISGVSSGIEPLFAVVFARYVLDNDRLFEINPLFEEIAKKWGFYSQELIEKIAEYGSLQNILEIPDEVKKIFITSHDVSPLYHIKMQAVFQKYTDNAVSKTVNFSHSATVEDVKKVYLLAYELGCKGVTIYRDKSRDTQVLNIEKKETQKEEIKLRKIIPRERCDVTYGVTEKITTGCGNLYITVNKDKDGLCEVFSTMGKAGGCASSQLEATSRMISLTLRSGIDIESVIKQLKGIRCPAPAWTNGGMILSCPDAIARVLEKHLPTGCKQAQLFEVPPPQDKPLKLSKGVTISDVVGVCPDCGASLMFADGCMVCRACGYSKCG